MKAYNYDVAISFAEEDRNIALSLALALELEGLKNVYYYPQQFAETWGRKLEDELQNIYTHEAKYAVLLVSDHYFHKHFAMVELEAMRKRSETSDTVYMLPVLVGEVNLALHRDIAQLGHLKWNYNPKEIAALLIKQLGEKPDSPQPVNPDSPQPVKPDTIQQVNKILGNVGKIIYATTYIENNNTGSHE